MRGILKEAPGMARMSDDKCGECGHAKVDHIHRPHNDKVSCWICGCEAVPRSEGREAGDYRP